MYKLDPVIIAPKVNNNREAHEYYLKHTMEQAAILREVVEQAKSQNPLDRVKPSNSASGSKPSGNTKNDRMSRTPSSNKKNKHLVKGAQAVCSICNECLFDAYHAMCLIDHEKSMNVRNKSASKKNKRRKEWKPTGKVFNSVGYKWKPTGRTFTLVGNTCPLTRITATNKVPLRVLIPLEVVAPEHVVTRVYTRRPKVVQIVLWYLDSGCSKHMTGDRSQLINFVHKFLGAVKFDNDQVAKIIEYGDYRIGNVTIPRVYYVEGLGHNLFLVGQFCDSDLEVAFKKHTCFVLHGLPRLKLEKDHLYSACAMGKSKKQSHKPKSEDIDQEKLYLLHMNLCGPMRVASVNGKKYILVIVDDYSRFTWVKFLASKDEAPDFIIKFLKMIQVRLNAAVRNIRTDNGTEFVNHTLRDYYEQLLYIYGLKQLLPHVTPKTDPLYDVTMEKLLMSSYMIENPIYPTFTFFGALCYLNNDNENLGKLQAKADIGIFIGYAPKKKAYRVYNRRTRKIIETIHIDFDELTVMASEQSCLEPALHEMTPTTPSSGLVPNPPPSAPFVPPSRKEWDLVFQLVFDEFHSPPTSVTSPVSIEEAPAPIELTGSPSSTSVD
ncbi:retrovirus-related pol polyprotein from transposon TNT 1-94 [Tanacetum coccineum]|uniref:Retrovirus-related pol polyprotein from transposon TNT 1-94 n=1 Tax=Tanacetum coccineum TaxID=301880 RepID=A0ABQ5G7M0_9ASTR